MPTSPPGATCRAWWIPLSVIDVILRLATVLLCVIAVGLSACSPESKPSRQGLEDVQDAPRNRAATVPALIVENRAFGRSRRLVARAVRDLQRTRLWDRLTSDHYVVRISSRPGIDRVPEDGHLADALLTARMDERGIGSMCDIMFFPAAMATDLERQRAFEAAGGRAAPTPRIFWASVLAHELAHCLAGGVGEKGAVRWEQRAAEALKNLSL